MGWLKQKFLLLWGWVKQVSPGHVLIFFGLLYIGTQISDQLYSLRELWELSGIKSELRDNTRELSRIKSILERIASR